MYFSKELHLAKSSKIHEAWDSEFSQMVDQGKLGDKYHFTVWIAIILECPHALGVLTDQLRIRIFIMALPKHRIYILLNWIPLLLAEFFVIIPILEYA